MVSSDLEDNLETIYEEEKSTTTPSEVQLIQQQLEKEINRHDNTLEYYKQRVKDKKERHYQQQRELEAKLLEAIAKEEDSKADDSYWLNNRPIPKSRTVEPKKLTKADKTLIRSQVKKAYANHRYRGRGVRLWCGQIVPLGHRH